MDKALLFKFMEELQLQCRFASFAYQSLRSLLYTTETEKIFFYTHAFLHHAVLVSRVFWPSASGDEARGEQLRAELRIDQNSPFNFRPFREDLEHFDERFQEWGADLAHGQFLLMNVMPQGTMSEFAPDQFLRNLDPERLVFYFRGTPCDLKQMADGFRSLEKSLVTWLKTHHPW